ncbi:oligosaccharide flippase family protein [Haloferax prahovense]|uniref:oligosaccharide flippase family protein n=1 Tax=Haloferax TaxID=2251 RepID=UPI0009E67E98|nr:MULTISPECIES: oligosaccharide flippase family protein [unclassified Haloferax]MCO8266130.1 oligosaccharide flippase family protein [Haloferax sp. AB510]
MSKSKSLKMGREVILSLGSDVVMSLIGFVGIVAFARLLGDVGLGEYRTVVAVAMVLGQVANGTGWAIRKRVSEVGVDPRDYLSTGLIFHAAFTLCLLVAFALLNPFVVDYFGSVELAYAVVLLVAALGVFEILTHLYAGLGYPANASWIDAVRSVLTLGFQILFIVWGLGSFGVVAGLAVATFASAGITAVVASVYPRIPTWSSVSRLYEFGKWNVPTQLLRSFDSQLDVLILRLAVGAGPVGIYTAAATASMPGTMLGGSIKDALSVKSSGVSSSGEPIRADLVNSVSYAGLLSIPIFFGAAAIPRELMVTVFGGDFSAAGPALVGLTLAPVAGVYIGAFEAAVEGIDRPEVALRIRLVSTAVHLILSFALVWQFELLGVIAAMVLTNWLVLAAYQFFAHRHLGGVAVTRPMLAQFASGAVMFAAVELTTRYVVTITSWVWLSVVLAVGVVTYFGSLIVVSRHFRETVYGSLQDVLEG